MNLGAALLGLFIAFVLKIAVMVVGATLMLRLFRTSFAASPRRMWLLVPEADRPYLKPLTWGLVFFFASEITCGIEVYILSRSSAITSSLHSLTSATAMALTAIGVFRLFDRKLFHLVDTSSACVALKTCGTCSKRAHGRCTFRPAMTIAAMLLLVAPLPILFASTTRLYADPRPYALPLASWNRWYDGVVVPFLNAHFTNVSTDWSAFFLPKTMLVIEYRIFPLVAVAMTAVSIVLFLRDRENAAITMLLAASGVAAYSYFEAAIYAMTNDALFGSLAHEIGEFLFLLLAAETLVRMYPRRVTDGVAA